MSFCARQCYNSCRKLYPYWYITVKFTIVKVFLYWKSVPVAPE